METVRYRAPDLLDWFKIGSQDVRRSAVRKGTSLVRREGERTLGREVREAAGAVFDLGKSALIDLVHRQTDSTEYVLGSDRLEIKGVGRGRTVHYRDVRHIEARSGDRYALILERGSVVIKPIAHLVAGRLRVPVGWQRNGLEVAYEMLAEELAARCGLEIE